MNLLLKEQFLKQQNYESNLILHMRSSQLLPKVGCVVYLVIIQYFLLSNSISIKNYILLKLYYFTIILYFTILLFYHFFNKIAEICWIKFCYLQNVSSFFKSALKFCWNLNLNSEVISNNLFLIQGIASWHCSS